MKHDTPIKTDFKAFYKSPWGMAFIGYFVAMGLVGALTPSDILTAYSWTGPFTDIMASIVPQIDKVTALGIDPDINRFYFSVMWAGSPMVVVWFFFTIWLTRESYLSDASTAWRMPFNKAAPKLFGSLIFSVSILFFFHIATDGKSKVCLVILKTLIGRFFIAQCFVTGPTLFFSIALVGSLGWLTGYIPRNIRKQNELENKHGK